MTSVLTGTALPFGLAKLGVDPANAGTSIQVSDLLYDPQRFRLQAVNLYRCISQLLEMRQIVRQQEASKRHLTCRRTGLLSEAACHVTDP